MTQKIALITGVSRSLGLGFAVSRQLAKLDHHVILAARDVQQAENLALQLRDEGFSASAVRLDLCDRASIENAANDLSQKFGRVDVLINNASAMPDFETGSVLEVDSDAMRLAFEVTVFGNWLLVQALLPLLRQAPAARIVNVSSAAALQIATGGSDPIFSPAYSFAKFTLNALTVTLAGALSHTSILINAVDPGSVATHPERGDDGDDRAPADAAKGIVWAATLGEDGSTGRFFFDGEPVQPARL